MHTNIKFKFAIASLGLIVLTALVALLDQDASTVQVLGLIVIYGGVLAAIICGVALAQHVSTRSAQTSRTPRPMSPVYKILIVSIGLISGTVGGLIVVGILSVMVSDHYCALTNSKSC